MKHLTPCLNSYFFCLSKARSAEYGHIFLAAGRDRLDAVPSDTFSKTQNNIFVTLQAARITFNWSSVQVSSVVDLRRESKSPNQKLHRHILPYAKASIQDASKRVRRPAAGKNILQQRLQVLLTARIILLKQDALTLQSLDALPGSCELRHK
jgi:hypothetical protein